MRLKQPSLSFVNTTAGVVKSEIWSYLDNAYLKAVNYEAHEVNSLNGLKNRAQFLSVLPELLPVEIGQIWNHSKKKVEERGFSPQSSESDIDEFLLKSEIFFRKFQGKHIGVQLSGGVDSSLIIGLLKHFGIEYSLIGFCNGRYEFRTESFIQDLLAKDAKQSKLINNEDYLPYSGLSRVTPHQLPNLSSCGFAANEAMAFGCNKLGIDALLTGCGGDVAFCNNVSNGECSWIPAIFDDSWLQDLVFTPKGVQVVSFFGDHDILECLWNLRRGQKADPRKLWARHFFRDFLPKELVEFTYKADFWGLYIDGMVNSLPEIRSIHKRAHELSGNPYFAEENLNAILKNDLLNCDQKLYQKMEARISAAVWIKALLDH